MISFLLFRSFNCLSKSRNSLRRDIRCNVRPRSLVESGKKKEQNCRQRKQDLFLPALEVGKEEREKVTGQGVSDGKTLRPGRGGVSILARMRKTIRGKEDMITGYEARRSAVDL